MFQVIFIFSDWAAIRQIIVFSTLFCCWGNRFSFCIGRDDQNLDASFEWVRAWVKMLRINAFSRNVTPLIWKFSLHMVEYKCLRENSTTILERERERESPREFIKKWKNVFLRLILKDKGGNQDYLPFCWF